MTTTTLYRAKAADGRYMYPTDSSDHGWGGEYTGGRWGTGVELATSGDTTFLVAAAAQKTAEYIKPAKQKVVAWDRKNPSPLLPDSVPIKEWKKFEAELGMDSDDEPIANSLYKPRYEDVGGPRVTIVDLTVYKNFPVNILDDESASDPDPSFNWTVNPGYLVFGEEFAHALRGTLKSGRDRLGKDLAARLEGKAKCWTHKIRETGCLEGSFTLEYEDRRTFPYKNGRRTENLKSTSSFDFSIPLPESFTAPSKAKAIAKYNQFLDDAVASIEMNKAAVCSHCDGRGVILVK